MLCGNRSRCSLNFSGICFPNDELVWLKPPPHSSSPRYNFGSTSELMPKPRAERCFIQKPKVWPCSSTPCQHWCSQPICLIPVVGRSFLSTPSLLSSFISFHLHPFLPRSFAFRVSLSLPSSSSALSGSPWMNARWLVEHMLLVVQYPPSEQGASMCVCEWDIECLGVCLCVCPCVNASVCVYVCVFIETYASCCTSAICSLNRLMECCCNHGDRPFSQTTPGSVFVCVCLFMFRNWLAQWRNSHMLMKWGWPSKKTCSYVIPVRLWSPHSHSFF